MEDGPKAKRLRGHDLELQKRKACTLTKGQSKRKSGLCEKLLSLWAHGQLSAKMCQELAHLAVLDGAQGQELAHMASCGAKWVAIATETSWPTGVKGTLYPHHMK